MTPNDIASAVIAGKESADADARLVHVMVRGVEIPLTVGNDGQLRVIGGLAEYVEKYAPMRSGRYTMHSLDSLISWARYYTSNAPFPAAYFDSPNHGGAITVIVDDADPGAANYDIDAEGKQDWSRRNFTVPDVGPRRALRAALKVGKHPRLLAWSQLGERNVDAVEFCEFIESNIDEVATTDVVTMARNLSVKAEQSWTRTVDDSGVIKLKAEETSGPGVRIPRRFQIAIPILDGDFAADMMPVDVEIRLKMAGKHPTFSVRLFDLDRVIDAAFKEMHKTFTKALATIPTYFGVAP